MAAVAAGSSAAAWTSRATATTEAKPKNVVRPRIVGTTRAGVTLRATSGTWTPQQGVHYTYRWLRCPAGNGKCTRIPRATHRDYTPTAVDVGVTLQVTVKAANAGGAGTATSHRTRVVRERRNLPVVALWHMNETTGTVMSDAAGDHDGTLYHVALGLPGAAGTAFGFNGHDSYASVPATSDLNPGAANITLTIRLKTTAVPAASPADADLIRQGTYAAEASEYKVELQHSGQASCGFEGSAGYAELIAGPRVNDGRWHLIQCIKAPTAIQLVVDGKVFTEPANVGSITNSAPVVIGARPAGDWYSGALDEVSIRIG